MNAAEVTRTSALESLIGAWRSGDALRAAAHFALDGRYEEARHDAIVGRDALVQHFTHFFRDGPRWQFDLDDLFVTGDRACVVYRFRIEGHGGSWSERAGCAVVRFDVAGAVASWREYDG